MTSIPKSSKQAFNHQLCGKTHGSEGYGLQAVRKCFAMNPALAAEGRRRLYLDTRDQLFLCPSQLAVPNKSHHAPLCHPERTRISYFAALSAATYAALRKESRMKSTEATVFDRKSGAAKGSAVRLGSRTKVSVPLVLPPNRHPRAECLTDLSRDTALVARSRSACPEHGRRNLGGASLTLLLGAFQPPSPHRAAAHPNREWPISATIHAATSAPVRTPQPGKSTLCRQPPRKPSRQSVSLAPSISSTLVVEMSTWLRIKTQAVPGW